MGMCACARVVTVILLNTWYYLPYTYHNRGEEPALIHDAFTDSLQRFAHRTRVLLGRLANLHHDLSNERRRERERDRSSRDVSGASQMSRVRVYF